VKSNKHGVEWFPALKEFHESSRRKLENYRITLIFAVYFMKSAKVLVIVYVFVLARDDFAEFLNLLLKSGNSVYIAAKSKQQK